MKQLLFSLFCLLFSSVLLAQTYYPMPTATTAQWQYKNLFTGFPATSPYFYNLKIKETRDSSNIRECRLDSVLWYKEDNQKLYVKRIIGQNTPNAIFGRPAQNSINGSYYLAFDFNSTIGRKYVRENNDTLTLNNITTFQCSDGTLRRQYHLEGACWYENWVEGVGVIESGCFEFADNCISMISDSGYVLQGGEPLVTSNPDSCRATMTATMVSPNVFVVRNTSPAGYQFKLFSWENCPYNTIYGHSDSIIIDINNFISCSNFNNSPIVYTPTSARIYLTLWNSTATCYTQNYIDVRGDTSCRADYTINRVSADSFLVRNITPPNTYTQASFIGRQCSPSSSSRVTVFSLPNQECLAIAPVPFGGCYPNYYPFSLTVSNTLCSNTKYGHLPYTDFCTTDCFFAGDTNRDSIANNMDLLPIALNMGRMGQARTSTGFNLDWVAHEPKTWTTLTPNSSINASFSDCDNSGVITAADTTIILRNYGFRNNRKTGIFQRPQTSNTAPVLHCQFAADTLRNIQIPYRLSADIRIGNATQTVPNLYGVAFSINYDTTIAQKASIDWDALTWLGTPSELLILQKNNAEGKIDVAIARNDHQPRTGAGKLATVHFFINDNNSGSPTNTTFQASVTNIKAIDENGLDLNIGGGTSSVFLKNMMLDAASMYPETPAISLYPNPIYNREFHYELKNRLHCSKIEIMNLLGQVILTKNNPESNISLPETVNTGVYAVIFYTNMGKITQKIVIL